MARAAAVSAASARCSMMLSTNRGPSRQQVLLSLRRDSPTSSANSTATTTTMCSTATAKTLPSTFLAPRRTSSPAVRLLSSLPSSLQQRALSSDTPSRNLGAGRSRSFGTWPKVRPKRIRVVTMDVTGTLVSFRGTLEDHYLGAARKCGVEITDDSSDDDINSDNDDSPNPSSVVTPTSYRFSEAFRLAYKETSLKYPCFGADEMSAKEWWRLCVLRSFELAGAHLSEHQQDVVFQRIYSTFGSHAAYEVFPDALPFLRWAQRHGVVCGVLSNADERYGDSILPMLGLTPDELQFQCFSKDLGIEKPDARIFLSAMKHSRPWLPSKDVLLPSEVLHIGNDFAKDFEGAKRAGMHTVLLDRYEQTDLADEWKRRGAQVFQDLVDVVEFLGRSNCQLG